MIISYEKLLLKNRMNETSKQTKSISRQMFGRASFELLRRKVILNKAGDHHQI